MFYGLAYYWVGKTCHVGYTENAITTPIEYGNDNALISVQKANANYRIINRITGMGGATNLPYYYPNKSAEGDAIFETENIEKANVADVYLGVIMRYNASPYTQYVLHYMSNPDATVDIAKQAPFYWAYPNESSTPQDDRTVEATVVKRENSNGQRTTMALALKIKGRKGDRLHFSGNGTYLYFRQKGGDGSVKLYVNEEDSVIKAYIDEWTGSMWEYGNGAYLELTPENTSGDYVFTGDGWYKLTVEGRVLATFLDGTEVGRAATIEMGMEDSFSIAYQHEGNSSLFFSYGDGGEIAYEESGIVLNGVDDLPKVSSHYEFAEGEWVVVDDTATSPATIKITGRSWITPSQNLMPSIYRESGGAERYYKAVNNTYDDGNGGKYTFNNQYIYEDPREGMATFEDIIPTINGIKNSKGQLIGQIADIRFDSDDNDLLKENSDEYLHSYFYVKLHVFDGENGFNLFEHALESDEATIEMTSGNCAACQFIIGVDKTTNSDGKSYVFHNPVVTDDSGNLKKVSSSSDVDYIGDYIPTSRSTGNYIGRQQDTSKYEVWIAVKKETGTFGIIMPNASQGYRPSIGDTFVITGISLPESYIKEAEKRLDTALIAYMKANNDFKFTFTVNLSRIFLENNEDFASKLNENARVLLRYNNEEHVLYVSNYTCKADNEILYEVTVDLTDTLVAAQSSLAIQLDAVKAEILSSFQGMRFDVLAQGLKYFLRKDIPDTAQGLITFLKGLRSGSKVYLDGGAEFGRFMPGFLGTGGRIDGQGNGEMESLVLRRFLEVPELRFNRVDIKVGDKWRAPGGGVTASVDAETRTVELKLEDGEIGAVAVGDICMGIYHSQVAADNATADSDDGLGNRTFAGFTTVYFTITEVTGERNEKFRYQLRPVSERWKGQAEPFEMMTFVAYGNFTDEDRQTSVYETRTYTRMLWKQNTWEISKGNVALQYGDLSNLSVFGMSMAGYSMYLNNVYFTGTVTQVEPDGTPVKTANDRGAWQAGHYDYYDRVSHGGRIWLCVNENGTDSEPAEGNADWLLQVDKGAQGEQGPQGLQGLQGEKGEQGIPGAPGQDGRTTYFHIKYSANADGSGMKETPDVYIGTYVDFTEQDSIDPKDYKWARFQGLQGEQGTQGIPGTNGVDGKTYYLHIKYSDDGGETFTGNAGEDSGAYIGVLTDLNVDDSTNPKDYKWSLIKGADGEGMTNCGQWKSGMTVPKMGVVTMGDAVFLAKVATANPPLWTLTDPQGNRLTDKEGYYLLTGEVNTEEYELLVQSGADGKDGAPGVPGEPGKDGKTLYTWIRYADDADGAGISNDPTGKAFIGFAYNKESPLESDTPGDYQWSDIKGEQGVPGEKGADGTQYYTWVAYSDNADGNPMYQQPTASTKYIGIAVNKTTQQEGTDPSEYTWSLFRGADGEGFTVHGQWKSGMTVPKNGVVSMGGGSYVAKVATTNPPLWTLTDPQGNRLTDKEGYYLLTGEVNTEEYEVWAEPGAPGKDGTNGQDGKDGTNGQDGKDGKDGVGVDSIQEFYLISDQKTGVTPYTPGWSLSVPTPTKQQRYLWNYECVIYTDGTYLNTAAAIIGMYSEDGRGIKSVTEYYARSTSATQAPTQWGTTPPTLDSTYRYLWNYEVVTYTDDSTSQTQPVMIGAYGDKGDDGRPGLQGLQGCVVRTSEWAAGVEYRNDSQLDTPAVRYIDVVLVRNDSNATGWDAYQCLQTHTSSSTLTYANTQYWEKFAQNVSTIFTSLIIAKNAKIRFLQGNQLLIEKEDGTVTAGLSGSTSGARVRMWAGSPTPDNAPFRVDEYGNLTATKADISGTINAADGTIGGFNITDRQIGGNYDSESIGGETRTAGMTLTKTQILFDDNTDEDRSVSVGTLYPSMTAPRLATFTDLRTFSSSLNSMPNIGILFDIRNNSYANIAFMGNGAGFLNGPVCGYMPNVVVPVATEAGAPMIDIALGNYVLINKRTTSMCYVKLPTKGLLQQKISGGSTAAFAVELTIMVPVTTGGNVRVMGGDGSFEPQLYNADMGEVDYIEISKGDTLKLCLMYASGVNGGKYMGYQMLRST